MKDEEEFIPIVGKEYLFNDNNLQTGCKLIFLGKTLNGRFISSHVKGYNSLCCVWNFCFPIPETLEVTLEQIAEKFNVNVENLKIKK